MSDHYYVYMLHCQDDTLYTGITADVCHRMRCHVGEIAGGAKYTRTHPPQEIAALWRAENKTAAARLEYAIKKSLTRRQKWELIDSPEQITEFLPQLQELKFEPVIGATLAQCLKGEWRDDR